MTRLRQILTILLILAAASVFADPLGFEVGVEASTGDLLSDEDFYLALAPYIGYTMGDFYFEAGMGLPVVPDYATESAYLTEEYALTLSVFDLTLGNTNTFYIDPDGDTDGTAYVTAAYSLFSVELDAYYMPEDFMLGSILMFDYEYEIAPGTLGAGAAWYFLLYEDADDGPIELYVSYAVPVGPVDVTFEIDPVISPITDDPELSMSALVCVSYSF